MDDDTLADLIDRAVRHARGEGPPPDLTAIDPTDRDEAVDVVQLVDALTFGQPPEGGHERVLERLRSIRKTDRRTAVRSLLDDLAARHDAAVTVVPTDDTLPVEGMRSLFVCTALGEHLLIVSADADRTDAAATQPLFDNDPTLTAVMLYDPGSDKAAIVDSASCRTRMVPGHGMVGPSHLEWTDPAVLLRRRFEEVFPEWARIDRLDVGQTLGGGIEETLEDIAETVFADIARSRPRLPHKRAARDFAVETGPLDLVTLANDVRSRRLSAGDCVERVVSMARGGTP